VFLLSTTGPLERTLNLLVTFRNKEGSKTENRNYKKNEKEPNRLDGGTKGEGFETTILNRPGEKGRILIVIGKNLAEKILWIFVGN